MTAHTADRILSDLAEVMRRTFPDRDDPGPVGPATRIFADLGMASIDVIVLAEKLEQYYGRKLPFGPFLAGLRDSGADDLSLGEVVAFLQKYVGAIP
jgi:acyl carrier protein